MQCGFALEVRVGTVQPHFCYHTAISRHRCIIEASNGSLDGICLLPLLLLMDQSILHTIYSVILAGTG